MTASRDDVRSRRSQAYLRADDDTAFLHREELRSTRLQLEYLKAELALQEAGIRSTIVLFGGNRILERSEALARHRELERQLQVHPGDEALRRRVEIAQRLVDKSRYYDVARDFARRVARWPEASGAQQDFVVTTGGGGGIMEAGNRGAADAGRPTIGFNISLPSEQTPNRFITPELCFQFRYFALRKLHFIQRAKALVALPGGYGTLDEVFTALCLVQTGKLERIPLVLVGEAFWRAAFDTAFLESEGVIAPEDRDLIHYAETPAEIERYIRRWYQLPTEEDEGAGDD